VHYQNLIFAATGEGVLKKLQGQECNWALISELALQGPIVSLSISSDKKVMYLLSLIYDEKLIKIIIGTYCGNFIGKNI
jgi:hypothetical protein